jgi:hypothetical protein
VWCSCGAAAVAIAAAGIADGALLGFRAGAVALAYAIAQAAGVSWRSCDRQRKRSNGSDKREQEQKSGGQAMHV